MPWNSAIVLSNVAPLWKPTSTDLSDAQNGPMADAGSDLINIYEGYENYVANGSQGTFTPPTSTYLIQGNQVAIDVRGWGDPTSFVSKAEALGMTVGATNAAGEIAEGWLPIANLPAMAQMDQVASISGIMVPHYDQAPDQSDRTLFGDAARSQYGVDGTGVKVGVISDSVGKYDGELAAAIASGDAPISLASQVLDDRGIGTQTDEGLAIIEEIYAIAPGASFYFSTAEPANAPGDVGFADAIASLQAAGCNVILDDLYAPDEPFFQNGVAGQAIDQAVAQGVTYLSAEGNANTGLDAEVNSDPTVPGSPVGGYGSQFRPVTTTIAGVGRGTFMNFNAGTGPAVTALAFTADSASGDIDVQWDNPFTTNGVTTEIDAYLIDPTTGSVVASARTNTIATSQPVQNLQATNLTPGNTYNLVLKVARGTAPNYIEAIPLATSRRPTPCRRSPCRPGGRSHRPPRAPRAGRSSPPPSAMRPTRT